MVIMKTLYTGSMLEYLSRFFGGGLKSNYQKSVFQLASWYGTHYLGIDKQKKRYIFGMHRIPVVYSKPDI